MMLRIGAVLLCATMAIPCSAEGMDMDGFENLQPLDQLRSLNKTAKKADPLVGYSAVIDGWELSFQAPADDGDAHNHGLHFRYLINTRSERYAKAFNAYDAKTGESKYKEGVFSFFRTYRFGPPFLNSSQLGQLDIDCNLFVHIDQSESSERYRRNFMVLGDLLKEVGRSQRRNFMVRSHHDGKLYPAGAEVSEIIIDGRKWFHRWDLSEMGSSESYFTALAKDRILKIYIMYNQFIPEKYYLPDSPRPGWMKSAYESVNTVMSSIRLKPPPGYNEEADPYIVKPANGQQ